MKAFLGIKSLFLFLFFLMFSSSTNAQFFTHYNESTNFDRAIAEQDWNEGDSILNLIVSKYGINDTTFHYNRLYKIIKNTYNGQHLSEMIDSLESSLKASEFDKEIHLVNTYILSDALRRNRNFNEASAYYLYLIELGDKYKIEWPIALANYQLAMIFYGLSIYQNAIHFFKESYDVLKNLELSQNNFFKRVEILSNIGLSYNKLNQYDSAMFYYNSSLDEIKLMDTIIISNNLNRKNIDKFILFSKTSRGVVLGNIGKNYLDQKEYKKAIPFLEKSFEINYFGFYEKKDALKVMTYQIRIYYELGDYRKFLNLVEKYFDEFLKHEINSHLEPVLLHLIDYYKNIGNLDQVKEYFEIYYSVKKERQIIDYLDFYKVLSDNRTLKQKLEFKETQKQLDLAKQREKINQYLLIFLIVFLLIGTVFSISIIIKRKRLQIITTELDKSNAMLNKANSDLNEQIAENKLVLGMVAHDLKQPIANIKGLILLNEGSITEQDDLILKSISSAENLIQDLLDITKLESSQIHFEKIEIQALIHHVNDLFKGQLLKKEIKLDFSSDTPFLIGSKFLIIRLITNLLSNAIKFSHLNSTIWITFSKSEEGNEFKIMIKDEGVGMSEEIRKNIFTPFSKSSRIGTSNEKGTGLGMAIVDKIVKIHAGSIQIESVEKQGTTVIVNLPSTMLNAQILN